MIHGDVLKERLTVSETDIVIIMTIVIIAIL